MSQFEIPEVSLSTESDDFTEDNWFSSPTTSFDGSSVNSIPWAEDVVKQNKEEWDRIERMFYGEESLPSDTKLRNEIMEWIQQFPHIRVSGQQAPLFYDPTAAPMDTHFEEVIEVHPNNSPKIAAKSIRLTRNLEQVLEDSLHIDMENRGRTSDSAYCKRSAIRRQYADADINQCLRITSGALLLKRNIVQDTKHGYETRSSARAISTAMSQPRRSGCLKPIPADNVRCIRIHKDNFDDMIRNRIILEPIHISKAEPLSLSARLIKIPGIPMETEWHKDGKTQKVAKQNKIRMATASIIPVKRPLRSSITLPAINLAPSFFTDSHERSASASYVACKSASKLRTDPKQRKN